MRFTLPLALLALSATTISASAENPPRHPEHWTLLMPTVTAATNCISQMVLANAGASSLARQGKWLAAITAIGDACDPPLRRKPLTTSYMAQEHGMRPFRWTASC